MINGVGPRIEAEGEFDHRRPPVPVCMDDSDILARIREMVDAEHELRRQMQDNPGQINDAAEKLRDLEQSLDQCWDLLRQRRAHREFAQNPDESQTRPPQQVEGYLQ